MTIDLYYLVVSPPSQAVHMLAKQLGIDVNIKVINLGKNVHKTEAYLKINPLHKIPSIVDDGYTLSDSHAIMAYLVNQYAPGNSLYPADPKKRAQVDKMMYFDDGTLFLAIAHYFIPPLTKKIPRDPVQEEIMKTALSDLNNFLDKQKFVAGDNLTLADISCIASFSLCLMFRYDCSSYTKIIEWKDRVQEAVPSYKVLMDEALAIWRAMK